MTEPKGAKARYKTTNWAAYNAEGPRVADDLAG